MLYLLVFSIRSVVINIITILNDNLCSKKMTKNTTKELNIVIIIYFFYARVHYTFE